jgi:hypothetical protein
MPQFGGCVPIPDPTLCMPGLMCRPDGACVVPPP